MFSFDQLKIDQIPLREKKRRPCCMLYPEDEIPVEIEGRQPGGTLSDPTYWKFNCFVDETLLSGYAPSESRPAST
jgi:hypothetical protein